MPLRNSMWIEPDNTQLLVSARTEPSRVKGLVGTDGQLLLLRKPGGEWDLPGGRRDPGETVTQTLERELTEELGFLPESMAYQGLGWRTRQGRPPVLVAFYAGLMGQGLSAVRLSCEHVDAQLVPADRLGQQLLPPLYAAMAAQWFEQQFL